MNGYNHPALAEQLLADRREVLIRDFRRDVNRSRLFREGKRLRAHQRNS